MWYLRLLFLIIIFTSWNLSVFCNDALGGLFFRAYEYSKDERTSLLIPSTENELKFKDYLSLSFDLKIRQQGEHFGYICRIIVDNQSDINLLLTNPVREEPYMCFIKNKQYLGKILPDNEMSIYEWNHVTIELEVKDHVLYVKSNGTVISKDEISPKNHSVRIVFGANNLPQFSTSDAAPMIIKNIKIGLCPECDNYVWPLRNPASGDLLKDEKHKLTASIANPEWMISQHLHWKHIRKVRFPSKTYLVSDNIFNVFYFVSQNTVTKLSLLSDEMVEYQVSPSIQVDRLTNQFIVVPDTEKESLLVYYDFEKPDGENLSFFDFGTRKWSVPIERSRQSSYSQHNKFFSISDSSIVQLFGYGFHKYFPEMNRVSLSGKVERESLPGNIPPRYLSAIGVTDSSVYIYGGMGNELGKQEYGVNHYRDLYKLNLNDYSIEKLWEFSPSTDNEVAAPTLILDSLEQHAKGLFFKPLRFQSGLVMKDLNLATSELTVLGDTIPFTFLDVSSFADLVYVSTQKRYYAATIHQVDAHQYEANIYSIAFPVLSLSLAETEKNSMWVLLIIGGIILISGGIFFILKLRRRHILVIELMEETLENEAKTGIPELSVGSPKISESKMKPGIYLLNGFQVIDKHSKDITGKFTPIMRQLLSIIILYTYCNNKGISNIKLKELFWFDKSEESFSNNRSVNMRKIRLLLEDIGDIEISSENGYWCLINRGYVYIDYIIIIELMKKQASLSEIDDNDLHNLLNLAAFGQLLPNMEFEWLDGFKADYSDSMINLLSKLRDSKQFENNDKVKMLITNNILKFDSLDEDSVRVKCVSLVNLKRTGLAHITFEQFTKEYKQILNESYKYSFEQFVAINTSDD